MGAQSVKVNGFDFWHCQSGHNFRVDFVCLQHRHRADSVDLVLRVSRRRNRFCRADVEQRHHRANAAGAKRGWEKVSGIKVSGKIVSWNKISQT